jgi:hypothetical protein
VEKTLNYALNEALETGYRAGRLGGSFDEMALRERIAQEIETMLGCEDAAALVRGTHID